MPNPNPTQSEAMKQQRYQRTTLEESCVPPETPLAKRVISVKLPVNIDAAIREMGKEKGAWLREVICLAALEQKIVDDIS